MSNYSDIYRSAKENYLNELKRSYRDWANKFHNRFGSWVIRLFGDEYIYLNVWAKGWDRYMDAQCIRVNLNEGKEFIYLCEEDEQRNDRDQQCQWFVCYPENSIDPIGNYENLIELMKEKLKEYGAIPPRKN